MLKAENFDIAIHFSGKQLRVVIPGESVLLSDVLVGPKAGWDLAEHGGRQWASLPLLVTQLGLPSLAQSEGWRGWRAGASRGGARTSCRGAGKHAVCQGGLRAVAQACHRKEAVVARPGSGRRSSCNTTIRQIYSTENSQLYVWRSANIAFTKITWIRFFNHRWRFWNLNHFEVTFLQILLERNKMNLINVSWSQSSLTSLNHC